jgi:hypothetical protein
VFRGFCARSLYTQGFTIRQYASTFEKYKQVLDSSDLVVSYAGVIALPSHTTYENDTACSRGVQFNVSLTSQPIDVVNLTFEVQRRRVRGVQMLQGLLSHNASTFTVSTAASVRTIHWSNANYSTSALIVVCSYDNHYDEDDATFYINATLSSSDPLYNSSEGRSASIRFNDIDDDTSGMRTTASCESVVNV